MKAALRFSIGGLLLAAGVIQAQYRVDWSRIGAGGGRATNAAYALDYSFGQNGSSSATGGLYSVVSGYWALIGTVPTPGAPHLYIDRIGDNIRVYWRHPTGDFVLQETESLENPPVVQWSDVTRTQITNGPWVEVIFPIREQAALTPASGESIKIPAKKVVKFRAR